MIIMGFIVTVNSDLFNIDYIRRSLIRIQSWILEKDLKFAKQFSRCGKSLENDKKSFFPELQVLNKWFCFSRSQIPLNLTRSQNISSQNEKFQNSLMLLQCTLLTVICSASWELGCALEGCFEDNSVMKSFSILRFKWKQVITFVTVKFVT